MRPINYLVLLSIGFLATMKGVQSTPAPAPTPEYVAPVYVDSDKVYPTGSSPGWGIPGPTKVVEEGYFHPGPPFKGPVRGDGHDWNPYSLLGTDTSGITVGTQCNPYNTKFPHPCGPGDVLECIEEELDGEVLCPGRADEMILNEFGEIQCGSGAAGSQPPPCTPGAHEDITCVANTKWKTTDEGPFTPAHPWTAAAGPHKWCYTIGDCQGNDRSPRKVCYDACRANHGNHSNEDHNCDHYCNNRCANRTSDLFLDKCTYKIPCFTSYIKGRPNKDAAGNNVNWTTICKDHYECASGFCQEIYLGPGMNPSHAKVCAPFAICRRPCRSYGQSVNSSNGEYCCLGTWKENGVCTDARIIPVMPDDIEMVVDPNTCQPSLYEIHDGARKKVARGTGEGASLARYELTVGEDNKRHRVAVANGSDDKTIVARSQWQFERYINAVEWMWGKADSKVLGHNKGYKHVHSNAKMIGEHLATERVKVDNQYTKKLMDLEIKEQELMSQIGTGAGSGALESYKNIAGNIIKVANSSGAAEIYRLLAEQHRAQSEIDASKMGYYTVALMETVGGSGTPGLLGTLLQDPLSPKKYDEYGSHGGPVYCCEGIFPWFSSSMCDTRFEENRVCVIEKWKGGGLSVLESSPNHLLDPVYPTAIFSATGGDMDPNYEGNIAGGTVSGFAAGAMLCGPVCAGIGAIGGAIIGALISYFKGWEIPYKSERFHNKRDELKLLVSQHLSGYANQILVSPDAAIQKYNTEHTVHNLQTFLQRDELKLALLDKEIPLSEFDKKLECIENFIRTDPNKSAEDAAFIAACKAIYPKWPFTTEVLRGFALDISAEAAIEHLVAYSRATTKEYETKGLSYLNETLGVMIHYLALYHQKAQQMHQEVAICLDKHAVHIESVLTGGAAISTGGASIAPPSIATPVALDSATVTPPKPCSGSDCSPVNEGTEIPNMNFGINSLDGGVLKGGSLKDGAMIDGGAYNGGSLTDSNPSLLAYRKKRIADRNRALAMRGKKKNPRDNESGADRLRRQLGKINGSHALMNLIEGKSGSSASNMVPLEGANQAGLKDPNAGSGSGSGEVNDWAKKKNTSTDGAGGEAGGYGMQGALINWGNTDGQGNGANNAFGKTATGLSQHDEDALLNGSQKGKGEKFDPDADTLFKQISRAYMHYGVPRLLKKKK